MKEIIEAIHNKGGLCLMVGGCVRDKILGLKPKDKDIEVFGIESNKLIEILSDFGKIDIVGSSFGVIKLTHKGEELDFSLPRKDSKTGVGHRGFNIVTDSELTVEEAALRRDFTINAISCDFEGNIIDPIGGIKDLNNKILRHTSSSFADDPLRVLRGFQFCSRFELTCTTETIELCKSIKHEFPTLPKERIWSEFSKWAEKGIIPSLGLSFLRECDWIKLFPVLSDIIDCPQDPEWHPEGDVWNHTLHVCDKAAEIADRDCLVGEDRIVLILSALCHDIGKPSTTKKIKGRIRSPKHDIVGASLTKDFLESIGCFPRIIEQVVPLIKEHMCHTNKNISRESVRRLALKLDKSSIEQLLRLVEADHKGRPPLKREPSKQMQLIRDIANELSLEKDKPVPIIKGRDLIRFGLKPGPKFGIILQELFDKQIEGQFDSSSSEYFLEKFIEELK